MWANHHAHTGQGPRAAGSASRQDAQISPSGRRSRSDMACQPVVSQQQRREDRRMAVSRVVPDLESKSLEEAKAFYTDVFGLQVVMDLGWIATLADPGRPEAQLSIVTKDATAPVVPVASIEVDDVDATYRAARAAGAEIVHELTEEPWGLRRFFVKDPDGHVINVLAHD
jgi:catechol 2,3-dioxygenase-like lactoylglutathione lyase family enzyme